MTVHVNLKLVLIPVDCSSTSLIQGNHGRNAGIVELTHVKATGGITLINATGKEGGTIGLIYLIPLSPM